ncbi:MULTISPECIES: putative cytokinetic ring protein SteA [unclassified Saccharopolyspora]|uniref:putative cytokinetic ring protein SteA n=1 Tax=unclassified Saccharopolyspora TaxID=2646250 RepID=UPI001CD80904|nr:MULTISPECIES: putative cytokinetic ring protein SteA [unclassified Saccharopolyspora]MCA1190225.1 thiamine pyrophosphokinase [Saccharopolyspora sp. 6T]MCA1193451.1 thiamine pyrophosphokinase [Saccharopolyspora sp. 6V]MCA1229447.1 thiamine pyrophosphokinase [Saccharopolyspora sp. 6M]
MKLSGLLTRQEEELPGVTGTARVPRRTGELPSRLGPGDIVLLDQVDLDRRTADVLVAAGVIAVVNAAPSISGRFPNLGPEVLSAAGVTLIDRAGREAMRAVKDGSKVRLHEGTIYSGGREIASGVEQDADSIADQLIEAKTGMTSQLEAFSANTIEFLRTERMLILDGVGVPAVTVPIEDRHVLVLVPGYGHADDLKRLKRYIKHYRPVLIGVDAGADTLLRAGYRPDVIVGDPNGIEKDTLKRATEVVVPAHLDGHAPGIARIQDLGIGALTFPASGNPEDLALLIADAHNARLVVTVGFQATLHEFLDRGRSGSNPSTFLTRLRLGSRLVDGAAVTALQRNAGSNWAVVLLLVAALLVLGVALAVSGFGTSFLAVLADFGRSAFGQLQEWFA